MKIIKKWRLNYIRTRILGYKKIRNNSHRTTLASDLNNKIAHHHLGNFMNQLIPDDLFDVEMSLRQFLVTRYNTGNSFKKAIMYAIGGNKKLRYPLPKIWLKAIENDIKIDNLSCKIMWIGFVFMIWGYGVTQGIKQCFLTMFSNKNLGNYVYFNQLQSDNLPVHEKFSYNIIEWYLAWKNRSKGLDFIIHTAPVPYINYKNIKIENRPNAMPRLTLVSRFIFLGWFVYASFYTFIFMLFGRYQYGILFNEFIRLKLLKLAKKQDLAKDYLFHNTGLVYRPLWSYEAERKGSRVLFYFYSQCLDRFGIYNDNYHLLTWSNYLVWTIDMANFIDNYTENVAAKEVVGPIWFSDNSNDKDMLNIDTNTVAVFDLPVSRLLVYSSTGCSKFESYVTSENVQNFLTDIYLVAKENNCIVMHKCKRFHKKGYLHPKYLSTLKDFSKKSYYQPIDADLSAISLIKATQVTISMAFTSTALIAKSEKKPSIYYDSTGLIDRYDVAAHGVQVIIGVDELRDWFKALK